jgi:hypothetical protein
MKAIELHKAKNNQIGKIYIIELEEIAAKINIIIEQKKL